MKILVTFYSRTGTTRKVAQRLSQELGADSEEIIDLKKRAGLGGFFSSGFDAVRKNKASIDSLENDPVEYDLVVVGTPIWAGQIAPAIRTYLTANRSKIKKVAFFSTGSEADHEKTWPDMREACGQAPVATLALSAKSVVSGEYFSRLKDFVAKLHE